MTAEQRALPGVEGPHRPVEAAPDVIAELRRKGDAIPGLDSWQLADYARELGLQPPAEPAGFQEWAIIEVTPQDDLDNPVLYWWGPEEDHGEED